MAEMEQGSEQEPAVDSKIVELKPPEQEDKVLLQVVLTARQSGKIECQTTPAVGLDPVVGLLVRALRLLGG